MPKITELYAWVTADTDENDEGVPCVHSPVGPLPLMGADLERAKSLRGFAEQVAQKSGRPVRLIRSTGIEVIDVVQPPEGAQGK